MNFDKNKYEATFTASLKKITASEKITRAELLDLSRSVLIAVHATEDIGYVNRLLGVLTPVNRKVAILYFRTFTGFRQDEGTFTRKDKKAYDAAKAACDAFLSDPHNNIWTWAERNVEVEKKAFDLDGVRKWMEKTIKKASEEGISQAAVLSALFKGGVEVDALIEAMQSVEGVDLNVTTE